MQKKSSKQTSKKVLTKSQQPSINLEKKLKQMINKQQELKFVDTAIASTNADIAIDATGTLINVNLTAIATGTSSQTRVGQSISIKSIDFKVGVSYPPLTNAPVQANVIKVVLVLDKQANGTSPAWTDVFQAAAFRSFLNMGNSKRFKILRSWEHVLNGNVGFDGTSLYRSETIGFTTDHLDFEQDKYLNDKEQLEIRWSSTNTDGAYTALTNNALRVYAISLYGGSNNAIFLNGLSSARIRYYDA